jgi:hypothetical protein
MPKKEIMKIVAKADDPYVDGPRLQEHGAAAWTRSLAAICPV